MATLQVFNPSVATASGSVSFSTEKEGGPVKITVSLQGLGKGKKYALHIHQFGDISGDKLAFTGTHFNPTNASHSCIGNATRHAGDLQPVEISAEGSFTAQWSSELISMDGSSENSIIGRSVVLHEGEDTCRADYKPGLKLMAGAIGWQKVAEAQPGNSASGLLVCSSTLVLISIGMFLL